LIGFSTELCVYLFSPDPIGKVSEFFKKIDSRRLEEHQSAQEDVPVALWATRPLRPPSLTSVVARSEMATAD
jgi:hypothetical protein